MRKALRRLLGGGTHQEVAALLTGVIGRAKTGGWSVAWASEGLIPAVVEAPTLNELVDAATAAAGALYHAHEPIEGAEVQLAIYAWKTYKRGPMLIVSGPAGAYEASDLNDDVVVHGATIEDLVAAVDALPGGTTDAMLLFSRSIAAL